MTDERLLTAAKLYEQARGRLPGDSSLLTHAGLPIDDFTHSNLTFLDGLEVGEGTFSESGLGRLVDAEARTRVASEAVRAGHGETLAYLTGITERDLDASSLTLPVQLLERLDAEGSLTTCLAAGRPNTGKTNSVFLLRDLYRTYADDLLVISNVGTDARTDVVVRSMHELMVTLLENRDRPKFVIIDEGSTHFNARSFRREVGEQWSPAVFRMAKMGVDVVAIVGHTGKDLHPEAKRLCNLALYKTAKDVATFYESWPAEDDRPDGELFGGDLTSLERVDGYDPDDAASWSWNLEAGLFNEEFSDWSEFLEELRKRGPTD